MNRAAIYSRYSSDNQREASIEDQARICEELIERSGWTKTAIYSDAAMSGANMLRPWHPISLKRRPFPAKSISSLLKLWIELAVTRKMWREFLNDCVLPE